MFWAMVLPVSPKLKILYSGIESCKIIVFTLRWILLEPTKKLDLDSLSRDDIDRSIASGSSLSPEHVKSKIQLNHKVKNNKNQKGNLITNFMLKLDIIIVKSTIKHAKK